MKKKIFFLYSLIVLALLTKAELKTLPLLNKNGVFEGFKHPVQESVITYSLSPLTVRSALSQYRGNAQRTGSESITANFDRFNLKWTIQHLNINIHGASKSSPAVSDDGFALADDTGYLRFYSARGDLQWQFYSGVSGRGFHSTPLIDEDTVYAGDYAGYIYAIDKISGKLRWFTQAGMTIGSSPFLYKNHLYVGVELEGPNGFLLALDARSGQWLWTSSLLGNHPHSSPALSLDGSQILMGSNTGELISFNQTDGQTLWSYKTAGDIKCAPAIQGQFAFTTSWDQYLHAVTIEDGTQVWKFKMDGRAMTCPSVSEKNHLIVASADKRHYVLDLSTGKEIWSREVPQQDKLILSSPLILHFKDRDVVVLTCGPQSVCLHNLQSGQVLQRLNLGGALTSSPVYKNGKLYFATLNAGLQVFQLQSMLED